MNRILSAALCAALLLAAGCNDKNDGDDGTPTPEEPTPRLNDTGFWVSMAVADSGPAVAYFARSRPGASALNKGSLQVDRWNPDAPGGWTTDKVHGFTEDAGPAGTRDGGNTGRFADMVALGNELWVAHYGLEESNDGTTPAWLRINHYDGSSWSYDDSADFPGSSDDLGSWPCIALDDSDRPGVAYYDAKNKRLKFAWRDGAGNWSSEVVDEGDIKQDAVDEGLGAGAEDVGTHCDLIRRGADWWIAYRDLANKDLKIARGTPGSWTVSTVSMPGTDEGEWPFILDDAGTVRVSYHDVGNQDLKLASRLPGGGWNIETVDDGNYVGADSVMLRSNQRLAIYYFDGAKDDIKLATRNDGSTDWTVRTVVGQSKAVGFSNNVALHGGEIIYATYSYTDKQWIFGTLPLP